MKMPIVKYIPEETNLPTNVSREINRYLCHNMISLEEYEQYRNAALKVDSNPVKYDYNDLHAFADKLQEDAEDEDQYNDARNLKWAISNTKVQYQSNLRESACCKSGSKWNEEKWEKENSTNTFETSLFSWRKQGSKEEHPAVLLTMLLDRYGYDKKNKTNTR